MRTASDGVAAPSTGLAALRPTPQASVHQVSNRGRQFGESLEAGSERIPPKHVNPDVLNRSYRGPPGTIDEQGRLAHPSPRPQLGERDPMSGDGHPALAQDVAAIALFPLGGEDLVRLEVRQLELPAQGVEQALVRFVEETESGDPVTLEGSAGVAGRQPTMEFFDRRLQAGMSRGDPLEITARERSQRFPDPRGHLNRKWR